MCACMHASVAVWRTTWDFYGWILVCVEEIGIRKIIFRRVGEKAWLDECILYHLDLLLCVCCCCHLLLVSIWIHTSKTKRQGRPTVSATTTSTTTRTDQEFRTSFSCACIKFRQCDS